MRRKFAWMFGVERLKHSEIGRTKDLFERVLIAK